MTEKEAQKKWCPFVRLSGGHNRIDKTTDGLSHWNSRCIASDCMMWEETTELISVGENEHYETDGNCGLKRKNYD